MGAIIMSVLVSVIAIVGGVYFYIQDKKETNIQFEDNIVNDVMESLWPIDHKDFLCYILLNNKSLSSNSSSSFYESK